MNELVSIIMPAYNASTTIKESINSVIRQTHDNFELLIVDDCSSDDTIAIISGFAATDSRIKLIVNNVNLGVAKSRNKAIDCATGEYIAFLDSDDLWCENKLKFQLNEMKRHHAEISCSSYYVFSDKKENVIGVRKVKKKIGYKDLLKSNSVGCLTVIYNVKKLGKLKFKSVGHEDYLAWLDITKLGSFFLGVKEPLSYYRVSQKSLSSNKVKMMGYQWKIYREHQKIPAMNSVYYFSNYVIRGILKRV
ncbi:glycosyltransferase family 2 protein [Aeromonas rivipollensis]|uniref:glycosyltransferase family 2 protein n=1 Tax=Aeromonas rivipollensis TaxID=948519 RepID=UPI001F35F8E9|nr:glycosyltransferase family 2 protein [Aeromonas rivipollensis]MCE9955874.1 glycosyltransferase [Aeromonas rivipollensis]